MSNEADRRETTVQRQDEQHYDWHGLPDLIGQAITEPDFQTTMWSDYLVDREPDGSVGIYRVIDEADSKDDLKAGGFVTKIHSRHVAGESIGHIAAPEDGWGDEIHDLPESVWGGFQ